MRTHLILTFVGSCLALHVFAGCTDDETGAAPTSSSSSGGSSGASSSGGSSGASSSGGSSGASSSGSSGNDGGGDGGGGTPVTSCATPVRIDTLRGVNGADRISAAGYGNKWAVTWFQINTVSQDNLYHAKARFFDGNALLAEQDLGTYDYGLIGGLASDGNGHGFFSRQDTVSSANRYVLDYATGAFASGTAFAGANSDGGQQMTALPGGGAISLYRSGTGINADRWLPGDPTWKTTNLAGTPTNSYGLRLRVSATGKVAAAWYATDGTDYTIYISTFDGATWSAQRTKVLAGTNGPLGVLEIGVYANGDVLVVYGQGDSIFHHVRLTASTGAFGTVGDVGTATNASTYPPEVIIDPMDRVTVTYLDNAKAMARRDLGAGFLQVQDLGAATGQRLDRDPTTGNVFIVTYQMPTLSIRGVTPTSNTWSAAIPMNLGISNIEDPKRAAATVFDSAGKPTVISQMDAPGSGGLELFYAKCQ